MYKRLLASTALVAAGIIGLNHAVGTAPQSLTGNIPVIKKDFGGATQITIDSGAARFQTLDRTVRKTDSANATNKDTRAAPSVAGNATRQNGLLRAA